MLISCNIDYNLDAMTANYMCNNNEPTYTAAIVLSVRDIVKNLYSRAKPNLQVAGCYVHQKPKVTFTSQLSKFQKRNPITRELGDLMVVCRDNVEGKELYNAAIFQLKKQKDNKVEIELGQCELLRDWPIFNFKYGNPRHGYDIHPKCPSPGAQYMIIDKGRCCCIKNFFWVSPAKPTIDLTAADFCMASFGHYLDAMLDWRAGRPICAKNASNQDEWSRLVWDIIEDIKNAPLKNSGIKGIPNGQTRICSDMSFFLQNFSLQSDIKKLDVWNDGDGSNSECNPRPEVFDGFGFVYIDLASQYRD